MGVLDGAWKSMPLDAFLHAFVKDDGDTYYSAAEIQLMMDGRSAKAKEVWRRFKLCWIRAVHRTTVDKVVTLDFNLNQAQLAYDSYHAHIT